MSPDLMKVKIKIKGRFISIDEFRQIIETADVLINTPDKTKEIWLFITNLEFREIDIALIGYLILCKQKAPTLSIVITLPKVTSDSIFRRAQHALVDRLSSYNVNSKILCGRPIVRNLIQYGDGSTQRLNSKITLHQSFSPIIPVGSYYNFPCQDILLRRPLFYKKADNFFEDKIDRQLFEFTEYYHNLAMEAYDRSCKLAKIEKWHNYQPGPTDTTAPQAGRLMPKQAKVYYENIRPLFNELEKMPIVFNLLFTLILENTKLPVYPIKDDEPDTNRRQIIYRENLSTTIHSLWFFTKELFLGINELAKNISEHSSTKQGILTLRAYRSHYITDKGKRSSVGWHKLELFKGTLSQSDLDIMRCLVDVNVFDLGKKGVVSTLVDKTKKIIQGIEKLSSKSDRPLTEMVKNQSLLNDLRDDIAILEKGELGISSLLSQEAATLKQQQKRSIAHIGLMSLAALVQKNGGKIIAASTKKRNSTIKKDYSCNDNRLKPILNQIPTTGTAFNILFPIFDRPHLSDQHSQIDTVKRKIRLKDIQSFDELINLDPSTNKESPLFIPNIPQLKIDGRDAEECWFIEISRTIGNLDVSKNSSVVCLDFDQVGLKRTITSSQLLRIIARLEESYPLVHFVFFNLRNDLTEELIFLNGLYCKHTPTVPFWSEKKATILINYIEHEDNRRFYFTDVMWGVTENEFYALNLVIDKVHFNSVSLKLDDSQKKKIQKDVPSLPNFGDNPVIINQQVLLPIDLLLGAVEKTLFEHNASFLLQNELGLQVKESKDSFLTQQILNKAGYKISNTHFKIGTKLHATDFYYAKRFFQNSFYTSRFAFLLAKKIHIQINEGIIPSEDLTLIGYGLYSELLISLTKTFLAVYLSGEVSLNIADNLIEDDKKLNLIKPIDNDGKYKNTIIIVPIASTFSTGFKINHALKQREISPPNSTTAYLNIVLACDWNNQKLHRSFLWESPNDDDRKKRVVRVNHIDESIARNQYYFLDVPTKWYSPTGIDKCKLCYPPNSIGEKALFSTDKTSVTPSLIFDLPKVRDIHTQQQEIILNDEHVDGLEERNSKYYLYSINTDKFLDTNLIKVKEWLGELYKKGALASETDKVILISDCHHTNIRFINLVNKVVFLSSATILHFDSQIDYVDNFSLVYGEELKGADKIYFVDDSLKSGETFNRIYFFVFNALQPTYDTRIIHGCISLINKLQPKDAQWIKSKLHNNPTNDLCLIHSFAHIHLFNSVDSTQSASIKHEQDRYKKLAESSVLDHFKYHFKVQEKKVIGSISSKERHTPLAEMVWATHYVYDIFSQIMRDERLNFEEVFRNWDSFIGQIHKTAQTRTSKDALLKILTRLPLTQYKQVRERVFSWISSELTNNLKRLQRKLESGPISLVDIQILKFYFRRASSLDSSRPLHEDVLETILKIVAAEIDDEKDVLKSVSENGPYQLELFGHDTSNKLRYLKHVKPSSIDNIEVFCYFYVAQVVDIINDDANRSINLERYLISQLRRYDELSQHASKIIRLLYFENSQFIETTWKVINKIDFSKVRHSNEENRGQLNESLDDFRNDICAKQEIVNNPRIRNLEEFFGHNPFEDIRYLSYLSIKELLTNDTHSHKIELAVKTKFIMQKMMLFFYPEGDDGFKAEYCNMGAFFGVHSVYKQHQRNETDPPETQPLIIFDIGVNSGGILETLGQSSELTKLDNETNIYCDDKKEIKTIFVYRKSNIGEWKDILAKKSKVVDQSAFSFLPGGSDFLLLIYIRKQATVNQKNEPQAVIEFYSEPQAVIGFYSDPQVAEESLAPNTTTEIPAEVWMHAVRYISLLRKPLSKFIEYHHENHEFLRLREQKQQQFMINLLGHGHDLIPRFAKKYEVFPRNEKSFIGDLPEKIRELRGIFTSISIYSKQDDKKLFDRIFAGKETKSINEIEKRYYSLAEAIFTSKYIETDMLIPKDVKITSEAIPDKDNTSFNYNFQILDVIMLELFINAKKNRWLFIPDDQIELNNQLQISFSFQDSKSKQYLKVCVSNTGPGFFAGIKDRLLHTGRVKENHEISGIRLINHILEKYLANDQNSCKQVSFRDQPTNDLPMKWVIAEFSLEQQK